MMWRDDDVLFKDSPNWMGENYICLGSLLHLRGFS